MNEQTPSELHSATPRFEIRMVIFEPDTMLASSTKYAELIAAGWGLFDTVTTDNVTTKFLRKLVTRSKPNA